MTRVALDSNILAYFAGVSRHPADEPKVASINAVILRLMGAVDLVAPSQALGELFVVLRKVGATAEEARAIILEFSDTFAAAPSEARTVRAAADLVVDHKLQYWDAMIITAATEVGCTLLLSEDMQHGFVARGLTVVNPLAEPTHRRLAALLNI